MRQLASKQKILDVFRRNVETAVHLIAGMKKKSSKDDIHDLRVTIKHFKAYASFLVHTGGDTSLIQEGTEWLQEIYLSAWEIRWRQLMRATRKQDKHLISKHYKTYKKILKKHSKDAKQKLIWATQWYQTQMLRDRYSAIEKILAALPLARLTHYWKTYKQKIYANMRKSLAWSPTDEQVHTIRKQLKKLIALSRLLEETPSASLAQRTALAERLWMFHDIVEHIILLQQLVAEKEKLTVNIAPLEKKKEQLKTSLLSEVQSILEE